MDDLNLQQPVEEFRHQLGDELQIIDNKGNSNRQQLADDLRDHPIFQIPWGHLQIKLGETERFIDLLFYHMELRYFKEADGPTIGMIICKTKDSVEVQYSLEVVNQPIGVSEYRLAKLLLDNLKSSLPSIEELEEQLKKMDDV